MSRIKLGYGSEWHMLRLLGRHREYLTAETLKQTGGSSVRWLDFDFTTGISGKENYGDAESKGLDFLPVDNPAREAWLNWWPQTGNVPNWDAVGIHRCGGSDEWLLVEAKANTEEQIQSTKAKSKVLGGGLEDIQLRLGETQQSMSIASERIWTARYYQYANRLAVLHFLTTQSIAARLLFIYLVGDVARPRATCPPSADGWLAAITEMKKYLGLTGMSELERRVHHLFLPVCPNRLASV